MIAKTDASGGPGLHPDVLAFSSSLSLDRALLKEDLLGSLAHLHMLARQQIIPIAEARELKRGLLELRAQADAGILVLPDEEDVHMAVEGALRASIGRPSEMLHTARSRNDQVALALKLHVREQCTVTQAALANLVLALVERARAEKDTLLPSYTHRQRAQPISLAYWLAGFATMFARDLETFEFARAQADVLPLGVGAIAGTSLPIDRDYTRELLGFTKVTLNGLDTVGDRDFALDHAYAAARFLLHASRLSTDLIDFTTAEFRFATLEGEIACGSSMMPQKRNPDVFELIRGKSGRAVGNLMSLLVTVKGLPGGYQRDLQEDRAPLLETGSMVQGVISILGLALPRVRFDRDRCLAALDSDATQATDLAEAMVMSGVRFRIAYQAVGTLVRHLQEMGLPLAQVTTKIAESIDARFTAEVLKAAQVRNSVSRKVSAGGTGPASVEAQLSELTSIARRSLESASARPRIDGLFSSLAERPL